MRDRLNFENLYCVLSTFLLQCSYISRTAKQADKTMINYNTKTYSTRNILRLMLNEKTQALGSLGETLAARNLWKYGVKTFHIGNARTKRGDLQISGTKKTIEVKTARIGKSDRWEFTLNKKGSQTFNADYLLLQCISISGVNTMYLIPREYVGDVKRIKIGRKYAGKYSPYKVTLLQLSQTIKAGL